MKMVCDASLSYAPLSWFEIVIIKVAQDDASILAFVEFSSNDALMIMGEIKQIMEIHHVKFADHCKASHCKLNSEASPSLLAHDKLSGVVRQCAFAIVINE
ncbi:hypothetical protein Tcan_12776 [Toxocara canis]|uniref:Uncharacterized protein n=1 Tax=Toxocara canis TaxID=6265 RepID=A0A0B2VLI4_TOXCA|nr:hypothetical protein Tcan_12776 [Toxocara canis]